MRVAQKTQKTSGRGYLDGQMLIAMPAMRDERFLRSVIYVCAHSSEGAMGIVVNQPAGNINFSDLLVQLEVIPAADLIQMPPRAGMVKVLKGGPVETGRGFVLHSADFFIENSTLPIDEGICLTATLDILKAIARGKGPESAVLALGYAGWAAGQLENEIQENGWLHCSADPELIFGPDTEGKYGKALRKIGVDRFAEHVALRVFAAELVELDRIGIGFGALGDHIHAQIVGERDDRAQDHRPLALAGGAHEGLIDLERVEREALQVGERGMSGAEIVERQAGAELADAGQHLRGMFGVLHHQGFGELELERAARRPMAGEHRAKIVDQIVAEQLPRGYVDAGEHRVAASCRALPLRELPRGVIEREQA